MGPAPRARPGSTWCTASSGSRPTPRPVWWCARRAPASAATATSAPATTTPRRRRCTRTSGCSPPTAALGSDLTQLFNYLTGYARDVEYQRCWSRRTRLRPGLVELIRRERAASPGTGHIIMKMNSLVDADMIDELYAASADGVRVELIVRGICCLRPGVPGLSENITVRSIVGRYLEHSRIYRFANGAGTGAPVHYIGSADLMPRNLDRRVEALTPVVDPQLRQRIDEILAVNLADDTLAWNLVDDRWRRVRAAQHDRHAPRAAAPGHQARRGRAALTVAGQAVVRAGGRGRVASGVRRRRRPRRGAPAPAARRLVAAQGQAGPR